MRKWFKRLGVIVIILVLLGVAVPTYLYYFHGYHGGTAINKDLDGDHLANGMDSDVDGDGVPNLQDPDANGDGINDKTEIVSNAEGLVGTLYDPLKGAYSNIGGRMGFIVCIDVPRIAYGNAGMYFEQLLTDDFQKHPGHYNTEKGINTPATPYFFRRVRNVYDFAKGNGLLVEKAAKPKVGDIVFYGQYHATLVVGVHGDGTYDEVEADPSLIFVKEHHHKKWVPRDVARILPEK